MRFALPEHADAAFHAYASEPLYSAPDAQRKKLSGVPPPGGRGGQGTAPAARPLERVVRPGAIAGGTTRVARGENKNLAAALAEARGPSAAMPREALLRADRTNLLCVSTCDASQNSSFSVLSRSTMWMSAGT